MSRNSSTRESDPAKAELSTLLLWARGLKGLVENSYAHNSRLFEFLKREATGPQIHAFYAFDAFQPPFYRFLQSWLPRAQGKILTSLHAHVRTEIEEGHSDLFQEMMRNLALKFPIVTPEFPSEVLRDLNYVFSPECAQRESFGFFCGCFYATELMSAKRCSQTLMGLRRLGLAETELRYLVLHSQSDVHHSQEVLDEFVLEYVGTHSRPELARQEVEQGVRDRLGRSEEFLRWYEIKYLG